MEERPGFVLAGTARTHAPHHDHPDLPNALKEIAAEAVQTIWQAANEAATGELATLRAEAERDIARDETASGKGRGGHSPRSWPRRPRRRRRPKPG
ncbi:hypothetical protein D9M68_136330 [compost metagenome]